MKNVVCNKCGIKGSIHSNEDTSNGTYCMECDYNGFHVPPTNGRYRTHDQLLADQKQHKEDSMKNQVFELIADEQDKHRMEVIPEKVTYIFYTQDYELYGTRFKPKGGSEWVVATTKGYADALATVQSWLINDGYTKQEIIADEIIPNFPEKPRT